MSKSMKHEVQGDHDMLEYKELELHLKFTGHESKPQM
jgi:hypothetical protein